MDALKPKATRLEKRKKHLGQQFADLDESKEICRLVEEERLPPVPGWFVSHLAASLPKELVLTQVEVQRIDSLTEEKAGVAPPEGLWKARLEGSGIVTDEIPPSQTKTALESFSRSLELGPFFLEITDATRHFSPRAPQSWISTEGTTVAGSNEFFIEGLMAGSIIR